MPRPAEGQTTGSSSLGSGVGLSGSYYDNRGFTGLKVQRTDRQVNFAWGTGRPASGVERDTFTVQWQGLVEIPQSGNYRFTTFSNDGARLYVNGQQVVSDWQVRNTGAEKTSALVALEGGKRYAIRMDFQEVEGSATARLFWQGPGMTAKQLIPQARLYLPGSGQPSAQPDPEPPVEPEPPAEPDPLYKEPVYVKRPNCASTLQSAVNAAPSGGVIEVGGNCVFRERLILDKPAQADLTIVAREGTEIRGSDVWSNFSRNSAGSYVSANTVPDFKAKNPNGGNSLWVDRPPECQGDQLANGSYDTSEPRQCRWPEQVFVDGVPQEQVETGQAPAEGQFSLDSERHVVLGEDPGGKTVEVTTRTGWVRGYLSSSPNISFKGFTMQHAANHPHEGALQNGQNLGWKIDNSVFLYAHGPNVKLDNSTGLGMTNSISAYGGQTGLSGSSSTIKVENNKFFRNNFENYRQDWDAGGIKLVGSKNTDIKNNIVADNSGNGIWCDIGCDNVTISDNTSIGNDKIGIFYEISDNALITNNRIWENNWNDPDGPDSWSAAGIRISNSRDITVSGNTLAWNRTGVVVSLHLRQDNDGKPYNSARNILVNDNSILAEDVPCSETTPRGKCAYSVAWFGSIAGNDELMIPPDSLTDPKNNNRGTSNEYWYSSPESSGKLRYFWAKNNASPEPGVNGVNFGGLWRISDFNATGGEENGRYLTNAEKDTVVASKGVPAAPQARD